MMWKTHLLFGFLIALILLPYINPENQILYVAIVLFGSLLTDIDHPDSKFGRKLKIIGMLFEHRGFFHSLFALALFTVPFFLFNLDYIAIPLLIGYGSHIFIDSFSYQGIMFLHPLSRWKIKGFMKTGGFAEKILFFFLLIIFLWKLFTF